MLLTQQSLRPVPVYQRRPDMLLTQQSLRPVPVYQWMSLYVSLKGQ